MNTPTGALDQGGQDAQSADYSKVKNFLITTLIRTLETDQAPQGQVEKTAARHLNQIYSKSSLQLPEATRDKLFKEVLDELVGFGPIQPLLDDPTISVVMVNGASHVYVEREGKISKTDTRFEDNNHVLRMIERIISPLGKRIDPDHPTIEIRLPDGAYVHAVIPPVALDGPSITIRKFGKEKLTIDQLIELGSITESIAEFLQACVVARLNLVISGGVGSGKTTLLNILADYIPEDERIITIEDSVELKLQQEHVVRLETKPPNWDNSGTVTVRDLVKNALRMRPDRIVVREMQGSEALDMLQAMNNGYDGSLTTVHASSPRDVISRLETMMSSESNLPARAIREQIVSGIDLIIQLARLRDGTRKIIEISELAGMEGDTIVLTEIFKFEQASIEPDGRVIGEIKPTGIRPLFSNRLEQAGFKLKAQVFGVNVAEVLSQGRKSSGLR